MFRIKGTVDDWINGSKAMAKTGVGALHTMQPAEIEIKDDRAIATTTISIRARSPYKGVDCILTSWAHQRQSFEKVGVWKIVPFEAIYIRHGVSLPWPGSVLGPLDERAQEIMKNARHPFKFLAWQMVLIGETVRNDLQGYDDEATWKPLVESNERLLATGED